MKSNPHLVLRRTLQANAVFSGVSGAVALAAAGPIAGFMGLPSGQDLYPTAILLLVFSGWLLWMASRPEIPRGQAIAVAFFDWLWVIGSLPLVLGAGPQLTSGGKWLLALLALAVADFAAIQTWAIVRSTRPRPAPGI